MRYIFEIQGEKPEVVIEIDDKDLESDEMAIEHAKSIGATYIWSVRGEYVPEFTWRREREPENG